MEHLPNEILDNILILSGNKNLNNTKLVCHLWYKILRFHKYEIIIKSINNNYNFQAKKYININVGLAGHNKKTVKSYVCIKHIYKGNLTIARLSSNFLLMIMYDNDNNKILDKFYTYNNNYYDNGFLYYTYDNKVYKYKSKNYTVQIIDIDYDLFNKDSEFVIFNDYIVFGNDKIGKFYIFKYGYEIGRFECNKYILLDGLIIKMFISHIEICNIEGILLNEFCLFDIGNIYYIDFAQGRKILIYGIKKNVVVEI